MMGQGASSAPTESNNNNDNERQEQQQQREKHPSAENIQSLIGYARTNYQENPTESLACLLQALKLNGGQASADAAMDRLRNELGDDIASHVGDYSARMERAVSVVEELLNDQSTFLYQQGNQEFLRMSMEDGSSVVCSKCNDVVSSSRWQQHQQYWCRAIEDGGTFGDDDDEDEGDDGEKSSVPMDIMMM